MGGDGGDGGDGGSASDGGNASDGSDGSVGTSDPGNEGNQSGNDPSASEGEAGFGSQADADAATAAQTGMALGDFGSISGFGNFGPTDATPGNDPANTPGFGAFADASLGPGVGYGDIGGFGVPGVGTGISGFGGMGGYGSAGPGSPGGFGNIGVGTANDSIAGIATSMGLGINDSTAQASNIGSKGDSLSVGMPAAVAQAATPPSPDFGATFGSLPGIPGVNSPAVAAINAAISPQAPSFSIPASPAPTNEELGIPSPPSAVNAPTVAEGLGTLASNQAAQNVAMNQNEGFNSLDAEANQAPTAVATVPGNFSIGIGNPSTAANVGVGPSSPAVASAAAPSSIASLPSVPSSPAANLSNAVNSETGLGFGTGLNFSPGSAVLIAQYPWLAFQTS